MEIYKYNQGLSWYTRPKDPVAKTLAKQFPGSWEDYKKAFSKGYRGSMEEFVESTIQRKPILPEPKPERPIEDQYQDYKQVQEYFEPRTQMYIEKEMGFDEGGLATPKRGLVDAPGSYAGQAVISNPSEFIQEVKIGNKIKYIVRHRIQEKGKRKTVAEGYFNTLEAAEKFRDENLSEYMGKKLTQEKFKELRLKNKDLTAKEFADYLNKETSYKPRIDGSPKWTRGLVEGFAGRTDTRVAYRVPEEIKTKIYNDYIKGETNLSDLGRKYFGDEKGLTNNTRQKRVFSILVGKGVDRSKFRKNFPLKEGEVTSKLQTQYTRKKRINEALNKAGKKTRIQYLDLERKILSLNDDILKMSDKEILNNKFLMKALNVDANKNNLAKGKITFDKYAHLSPKEKVAKIRDLAKRRLFFQPEHIREVATELQNIIYPNNIGVASGKIGSYMTNIKEYVRNNPKGKAIPAIKNFLNEFDLAVSEGNNRLGFKNITYDSKAGTSNVVESIKTKSQILKQPSRGGVTLGANLANVTPEMLDFRKLPGDLSHVTRSTIEAARAAGKSPAFINALKKARVAGKWTGVGLAAEPLFAAPFVGYQYLAGDTPERMWGDATLGVVGETAEEEIRKATGERGYATQQLSELGPQLQALQTKYESLGITPEHSAKRQEIENKYKWLSNKYNKAYNMFVDDTGQFNKDLYNQALNNYTAGIVQIGKFKKQLAGERREKSMEGWTDTEGNLKPIIGFANGGIASLTRTTPPTRGPQYRGLDYLKYYGR